MARLPFVDTHVHPFDPADLPLRCSRLERARPYEDLSPGDCRAMRSQRSGRENVVIEIPGLGLSDQHWTVESRRPRVDTGGDALDACAGLISDLTERAARRPARPAPDVLVSRVGSSLPRVHRPAALDATRRLAHAARHGRRHRVTPRTPGQHTHDHRTSDSGH